MTHKEFTRDQRETDKLAKRLRHQVGDAIRDYNMIEEGDKVMVCVSGGKDSHALLAILLDLQRRSPVKFDLVAVNLDQKQPGFPAHVLPAWFEKIGVPWKVVEKDTYSVVKRLIPEGDTTCSLCSRLRRGNLYATARELGATKIALGHHRDDMINTFFLNLFFGGTLKTMPPKLKSDDGAHVVIRPLAYCAEADIEAWANAMEFPIIPCDLCGSQPDLQRATIKEMLKDWGKRHPGRLETIFRALSHVSPSHLLDPALFDFMSLRADGVRREGPGGYGAGRARGGAAIHADEFATFGEGVEESVSAARDHDRPGAGAATGTSCGCGGAGSEGSAGHGTSCGCGGAGSTGASSASGSGLRGQLVTIAKKR